MPRELKPCGTTAAWRRHYLRGEKACDACAEAWRVYQRDYYRLTRPNAKTYRRKETV